MGSWEATPGRDERINRAFARHT